MAIETVASRNALPVDATSDGASEDPLYMDKEMARAKNRYRLKDDGNGCDQSDT